MSKVKSTCGVCGEDRHLYRVAICGYCKDNGYHVTSEKIIILKERQSFTLGVFAGVLFTLVFIFLVL